MSASRLGLESLLSDLDNHDREGRFRSDLYYRLSVFPITVPPLRERVEDIPVLVWHFVTRAGARLGRKIERVPDPLMKAFMAYSWPGNIREMENIIERAIITARGPALAVDPLFLDATRKASPSQTAGRLDEVERAHILKVVQECGWKIAGRGNAAERLGLKRGTLQFRMRKLGIRRPTSGPPSPSVE